MLLMSNYWGNLNIDNFRTALKYCQVLRGFPLLAYKILQNIGFKLPIFSKCGGTFFCGQDNLLGGQVREMGRFNLLDGQSNLLGGQMLTQLACYLSPW